MLSQSWKQKTSGIGGILDWSWAQKIKTFVAALDTRRWRIWQGWIGFPRNINQFERGGPQCERFPSFWHFFCFSSLCKSSSRQAQAADVWPIASTAAGVRGQNLKWSVNRNLPQIMAWCGMGWMDRAFPLQVSSLWSHCLSLAEIYSPWTALRSLIDAALLECSSMLREGLRDELYKVYSWHGWLQGNARLRF